MDNLSMVCHLVHVCRLWLNYVNKVSYIENTEIQNVASLVF